MNAERYTYDFTVHPRDVGLDSTCWMNGESLSRPFSQVLPANGADLLDLALAIYAADRALRRVTSKGGKPDNAASMSGSG